jgi:anti-sigma regulatory factor (Ser/Thr protein kinase)
MSHGNELATWPGDQGACALATGEGCITALALWARAFPGTPGQVGEARRFVGHLLPGSPFYDDAVIVLCELFTNAVLHTDSGKPGGLVTAQVARWRAGVRIAVTDQGSPGQPVIRDLGAGGEVAESGRGLHLAAQLAHGLTWHDDPSGRTIAATWGKAVPAQWSVRPWSAGPVMEGPAEGGEWPWPG